MGKIAGQDLLIKIAQGQFDGGGSGFSFFLCKVVTQDGEVAM